jgi:universal stress protein A
MVKLASNERAPLIALTRILVPTNLGEPSKAAIRYGVAFARQFNAKLYLAHVLTGKEFDAAIETERVIETLMPEALLDVAPNSEPKQEDIARNAAREDLGRLLDPQEEKDTRAEYLLRAAGSRSPGDEIVACATELGVELIVMGKHRLGFVEQLLAGSVTEKVIRQAPCPVLIVQHPEHEFIQ